MGDVSGIFAVGSVITNTYGDPNGVCSTSLRAELLSPASALPEKLGTQNSSNTRMELLMENLLQNNLD